ncbi:MAG: transglutaminase-like cysteine peptidase [Pseudobdellovibrionaceae bacterium]
MSDEDSMPRKSGFLQTINTHIQRNRLGELLVVRGKISAPQLKEALRLQRMQGLPLGQILCDSGLIHKSDIQKALALQSAFRVAAAVVTLFCGSSVFVPRQAAASDIEDVPAAVMLASASAQAGSVYKANLFGTQEQASRDLSAFTKWSAMFERFQHDAESSSSTRVLANWKENLEALRGLPLDVMARRVNDLMNRVRYIGDNRNWGKSDYWETPVEFMTRGGDCEDFAIAKYASLRALGVSDNAMRIAIVKDMQKGIPHAILIVYTEDGPMVLDNQIKTMTAAEDIHHYKPIFSINRTAWWVHTDRIRDNSATQIASAAR